MGRHWRQFHNHLIFPCILIRVTRLTLRHTALDLLFIGYDLVFINRTTSYFLESCSIQHWHKRLVRQIQLPEQPLKLNLCLLNFIVRSRITFDIRLLMVSCKLLLERCQPFGDMILPFDQDEKKGHCLFVFVSVLGMLKLQPKLFTSSFINLAQHLLDNLLIACKLF